ncbi:hypothetical protein Hanom_Chr10g00940491 [Helianthus anomalus]
MREKYSVYCPATRAGQKLVINIQQQIHLHFNKFHQQITKIHIQKASYTFSSIQWLTKYTFPVLIPPDLRLTDLMADKILLLVIIAAASGSNPFRSSWGCKAAWRSKSH